MNEPVGATVMIDGNGWHRLDRPDRHAHRCDVQRRHRVHLDASTAKEQAPPRRSASSRSPTATGLDPATARSPSSCGTAPRRTSGTSRRRDRRAAAAGSGRSRTPAGSRPACSRALPAGRDRLPDPAQRQRVAQPHLRPHADGRDDVCRRRLPGTARTAPPGTINNSIPMTIGGKINCDQVEITCDYFSGLIDFIKITRG